jgi:outer membrane protein assembly factor BamA
MRWLGIVAMLAACGTRTPSQIPVASCDATRIASVHTSGADRDLLGPLSVLAGTLDDPPRTDRVVALTQAMLRGKGYMNAKVALVRHPGCGVELDVTATLGPRFRIAKLEFDTDDEFPEASRRAIVATNLGKYNAIGGMYHAEDLSWRLPDLRNAYIEHGWIEVKIGEPSVTYDQARAEITVRVPITAGKRFKIGELKPQPEHAADPVAVAAVAALGIHSGEWYDADVLRTAVDRARRKIGRSIELYSRMTFDRGIVDFTIEVGK